MSDRSTATLIIHSCPQQERDAVVNIIWDHCFDRDYDPDIFPLDIAIYEQECSLDENDVIAGEIIEQAPGCAFEVWVDPKYEYPGVITRYHPDLGRFDGVCDESGRVYFTVDEIRRLPTDPDALAKVLGEPWDKAFER